MARELFGIEKGLAVYDVNGDLAVSYLNGSAAPGGDTGDQDAAPIGSQYNRTNGLSYIKIANAGATADWINTAEQDVLSQEAGVTTVTTLDSVLVDDVLASEWEIHAQEDANPTRIKVTKIIATHNGHSGADATSVDDSSYATIKLGPNFNADIDVELNGAAAAQVMRIRVTSSTAGVTFTARRTDIRTP